MSIMHAPNRVCGRALRPQHCEHDIRGCPVPPEVLRGGHLALCVCAVPGATPLKQLIGDAMILARSKGYDVFNALDLLQVCMLGGCWCSSRVLGCWL